VSSTTPALLAAAAGVGLGHAILPDHWVPLAVIGRTRRYPLARVARLSLLAGIAHVMVSLLLGAIIVAVGLQFRSTVQSAQDTIVGTILILTGLGFAVFELTGHGHGHSHDHAHGHADGHSHDHDHGRPHDHGHDPQREHALAHLHSPAETDAIVANKESRVRGLAAIMVPFGAAASPDLTILPVFLAATAAGAGAAVGALIVFSAVTIGTIAGLTLFACFGGYQLQSRWLDRWGNAFSALVLVTIGALVLTGVI
jgi:nickel/cobalt transporter (NicO) family protein